ncbi:hypothetical protein SAMN05216338_105713 [Bradyrhizobium sp. Rc2d]|uniref:hypothetical protein n=1 Tax=Bradyrhizobium sp. Rc2d TaxID=1855321 RepID=UPI000891D0CE|nr:hypothetical protein [Bradyrhizobium sp. Rc2d]SDJ62825.1 hypothetical protein SAMN05216338_105713 [Bradyrhizobium sp. Rc2d]
MTRSILVSLAILALSTSVTLAAQRTHHTRAVKPSASAAAMNPTPYTRPNPNAAFARMGPSPVWQGGVSSKDHALYLKNLHDSGYNPKSDYANGLLKTQ